jgi:hypothetical protein
MGPILELPSISRRRQVWSLLLEQPDQGIRTRASLVPVDISSASRDACDLDRRRQSDQAGGRSEYARIIDVALTVARLLGLELREAR